MKRFSGLLQFILGFFLGITILVGLTSALGYVMFSRLAATPSKPVFPEENKSKPKATTPDKKAPEKSADKPEASPSPKVTTESPSPEVSPSPSLSPSPEVSPSPSPSPEAKEDLPKGAYKAKVTWSGGLSLRSNPSKDSERVGGAEYNSDLIVLETSADGVWAKVRSPNGGQEGWVKVGNFKKAE